MKKVFIILVSLFAMMAAITGLKAQEVTIPLKPGWTWIGYPSTDTVDFATALGTFTPREGDMIACEYDFSEYFDGGWLGDIQQFYPGYGYMYYSTRPMPVMVTFNAQQPAPQVVVTTSEPSDVTAESAIVGGTVTVPEGAHVFLRGVCWSTEPNPDIDGDHTTEETGIGSFSSTLDGLNPSTTYFVRAYAVSDYGLAYGNELSFTTEAGGSGGDHGYVDLGLPSGLLWATCNVGAETAEEYGDYFAWGETQPKDYYYWSTYQYCNGSSSTLTKYCNNSSNGYNGYTDNLTTLLPEDDAATANWGSDWRMPTNEEWQELYNNTTVTWTTRNGVDGRLFTASNGNSLFLPAAGFRNGSYLAGAGGNGDYWSSSLNATGYPSRALGFDFGSGSCGMYNYDRNYGLSVRAVHFSTQNTAPTGAINGKFTINADGDQVYFSQGNLQYIGSAATPYWKFADNQWDYIGETPGQNSSNQNADRDIFGWGTSGYNHGAVCYQPWSTSTTYSDYYAYGSYSYNLYDQTGQADWGYNPISNGGNQENQWRTLTTQEWQYVFDTRSTPSGIRYAKAKVNDVNGVILLPDDWSSDIYSLSNINSNDASYNSNTISANQWITFEDAGAVFLPASGNRNGTSVSLVGNYGNYWSSSHNYLIGARYVGFYDTFLNTNVYSYRNDGYAVRLARDVE